MGEIELFSTEAFQKVTTTGAGKGRLAAVAIIGEGVSLAALSGLRPDHSRYEDKVAINTLIQSVDDLQQFALVARRSIPLAPVD